MGFRDLDVYASEAVNIARAGEPVFLPIRPLTELLFFSTIRRGKKERRVVFSCSIRSFFSFFFFFSLMILDLLSIVRVRVLVMNGPEMKSESDLSFFLSFFLSFIRIHIGYSRTVSESTPGIERKSFAIDRRKDMLLYQELTFRFLVWGWRFLPH